MAMVAGFVQALACKLKMVQCLQSWAVEASSSHFKLNSAAGFVSISVIFAAGGMKIGRDFSGCSVLRPWQKFHLQGAAQPRQYSQLWHAGAARRKETQAASIEGEMMRRSGEHRSSRGLSGGNSEALSSDEKAQKGNRKEPRENDLLDELEEAEEEEEEEIQDEIEDIDDDLWEDEESEEQGVIGDGGDGGGFVLGGASWGDKALKIAEEILATSGGDLVIYAFKVRKEACEVLVRLDKLSNKYGSPTVEDIDEFSSAYGARLEEAGQTGLVPDNLALEVSSPGAERFLCVPQDLLRFKELPMYVRYTEASSEANSTVKDGVFELDSINLEAGSCTWKVANVRINRDSAGKGRGLTRKQRLWRLDLPFTSVTDVRLYVDV
ncbi:hypothetical protein O6H91_14G045500 [Diphasiastrum complanatum]|uniref:Uncharacterized protein n=1 Tax=Diphasiastrum complanatum TaxID=34168 RepID=A0ACC2BP02_DIPCM|nr:hypothetical protein O6H91_14G045500 [Diphasiastrum complanatum]